MKKINHLMIVTTLALVGLFVSIGFYEPQFTARADWAYPSGYNPHGGYVDQLVFSVYPSEDLAQALLAIQSNELYAYDERLPYQNIAEMAATPGVEVTTKVGVIYRQHTFNCQKFPTNITAYRLALAYGTDKYKIVDEATGGLGSPMDGAIPIPIADWTYEDEITDHFYTKDIASGNATLEAAGFKDLDGDGWREYDVNGNDVWDAGVDIDDGGATYNPADPGLAIQLMASAGWDPAIQACLVTIEGMNEMGLRGYVDEAVFDALIDQLESGEFNVGCFSWNIDPPGEPDLLYEYFHSESGTNLFFYRYNNSEYDYQVESMMDAPTKAEAIQWAWNCSEILLEEMPMLTCYNDVYTNTYRTDIWEGYVVFEGLNRMGNNPYTMYQLRLKEAAGGPFGPIPTVYRSVLSEGMDTTNILMSDSGYTDTIMNYIYPTLWYVDPYTWEKVPNIAYEWTVESTTAAGDIEDGQLFTFTLYENCTWTDGTPLTSADVKYSLETIWDYGPYDFTYVENIYRIDTPDDYTVEIYTTGPGYFEFSRSTQLSILPKHIWEPHFNFTAWVPETQAEMTGYGPYKWNTRVTGEYVVLDRYADWHFGITHPIRPIAGADVNLILFAGIGIAVIVIVIIAGVYFFRIRK